MNTSPPKRALVVIDVQNEYVGGGLPIEYPSVDGSLSAIAIAMDHARANGLPVIVVQNSAPPGSPLFARGSHGWQLHAVVADRPRDHLVDKTLPSAFAKTDLDAWLRKHTVDTVTIAGFMTHNCDAATALEAMHRGYAVEFLADASGSVSYRNDAGFATAEEIHRVFSVVLHSRFASVATTPQWMRAVSSGQPLARSSIVASQQAALQHQTAERASSV